MARRYSLKYEYSKDGVTWIDFSDAVDSRQTKITQSLCTMGFKSAKDSVTFTLPATSLPVKNQLVADLLGPDNLYFRMDIPSPVPVFWDGNQVLWNSNEVFWRGLARGFTGYIDKTSVNLQSYPLPTSLTLTAYDVSFLNLDNKVNKNLLYEDYSITSIVHELLTEAGYSYDLSALDPADDITLEAFVVDKEKAKTYREYIDTLLFEAGGYVLDFTPEGIARIVHLPWDDANGPSRVIDNPMNEGGIQIKSEYLKEDGVKLKWATLAWSDPDRRIYDASISRKWNNGLIEGDTINAGAYWPKDGDVNPIYMQYSAEWLDEPYLKLDTRKQNEDLSIIMAKNVYAKYYADKNGVNYLFPEPYAVPAQYQTDPYNFTSNPMIWPLKAWFLLKNETAGPINLASFELCGETLFRSKINTLQTADSENPKEYTSEYIFDATQAQNFLDFYWHFLQTSRFTMSWSEPLNSGNLGDVVEITQKGMAYTQDAVVVAKTVQFINDLTPIVQYSAVGVAVPVLASGVAYSVAPPASAANPSMEKMQTEQAIEDIEESLWDFEVDASAIIRNDRWVGLSPVTITATCLHPNIIPSWQILTNSGTVIATATAKSISLSVPYDNSYEVGLTFQMSATGYQTLSKTIPINNETEYDHDFGAWEPVDDGTNIFVLPDHFTDGGIDYDIIQGDFFVAKKTFAVYSEGSAVTPSGTEDPADLGWYERKGNGTNAKPYYWLLTADTSVVVGKTYGTVSGQAYTEGSPYQYASNSWYNSITATAQNARKMLSCLANVLSDPNIQPTTSALYAWFENLVAKNAIIKTLNATDALFENIHVSGLSRFDGEIHSSALETTLYRPGGGTQTLSLDTNNQFWSYNSFADILNTAFPSDGYYLTTGTYTVWRKGTGNLLLHSITTDSALPDNTTIYTSTRKQNLIVSVTGISGGRLICDGVQYTLLYSDYPSVTIPVDNGSVIKTRGNFVIRDGGLYVHDNQADFSRKYTPFNSSRVPVALADYGSGSITVTYNSTTYTSPALYKWLGMSSASGGGYTSPGSTLSFTDEMGNAVSGHAISSVFWTSASEITFLDSNLDRYSIDTASYYRAFSASFSIAASIDSVVAATITPASSSATLGTPSNPWPAIHGDEVYGAVFN